MSEIQVSEQCAKCAAPIFADAKFCAACGGKIAVAAVESRGTAVKNFVAGSLNQAEETARELLKDKTVQKVAGGAALGAGVATVLPFITMGVGATLGAAFVAYKRLTKD